MVFDIAPNRLVRIQLRRVRRQEEQPELAVETLNIVSNPTSMMNRVVIEDQENRLVNVLHQSLEETKKRIGVHVALNGLKAKLAARRDGRDQIDAEATARITDDRSFTPGCPGGATVIIRPNAGFIAEIDGGADFFCFLANFRVGLFFPLFHGLWLLLVGPMQGFLRRQPQAGR